MAAATKKEKKKLTYTWKASTSSGHITNLKQSILETFDIYACEGARTRSKANGEVLLSFYFVKPISIFFLKF
jgi:hypothetical protein